MKYDVIIVGGGLAGLTASIGLSQHGFSVLVLEKHQYPRHKVCGEYISNEVLPFLESLELDFKELGAVSITKFCISNERGRKLQCELPLGGFGLSRYALDHALYELAKANGVVFVFEAVTSIQYGVDYFLVETKAEVYTSRITLGAYGKRSSLDKSLNRSFIQEKSPWLGVKGHFQGVDYPENEVSLHCFPGGYGGLSKVENSRINFCYLSHYKQFKRYKDIDHFNNEVVMRNPFLNEFLQNAEPIFDEPMSIAQISFSKKELVHNHVLMCGDSAGLIHPLCGNGMAMAIHAGKIAADVIMDYVSKENFSRKAMEIEYAKRWRHHFAVRLYFGRKIQHMITNPILMNHVFSVIPNSQRFLAAIIKRTHGKPILV